MYTTNVRLVSHPYYTQYAVPGDRGQNVVARLVERFSNEYNKNFVRQGKESFEVCKRGHPANLAFSDSGEICKEVSQKSLLGRKS